MGKTPQIIKKSLPVQMLPKIAKMNEKMVAYIFLGYSEKAVTFLRFVIAPPNCRMPRAVNIALCGKDLIDAGEISNVMNIEPLYIRRSEAEELWEKRRK